MLRGEGKAHGADTEAEQRRGGGEVGKTCIIEGRQIGSARSAVRQRRKKCSVGFRWRAKVKNVSTGLLRVVSEEGEDVRRAPSALFCVGGRLGGW